ncbi:hypothetical protein KFK09_021248 [Dendrobium nobile]|uniref:Uncharacterized protein n=1 Tax=Dendrobium nobile TaxID=94219 RepID=A0A8T3APC6_DENNO|nr:hypothetical protein KFK09_021248 [Dendrobium nobile]
MDVCHVILGRPWQFDAGVMYNGKANVYSLEWKGRRLRLLPGVRDSPQSASKSNPASVMQIVSRPNLLLSWKESSTLWALVITDVSPSQTSIIPTDITELLEEFQDVCPQELPAVLPPLRNIQHQVDLQPNASLPNLPHYRLNPMEQQFMQGIIEELLSKQLIQTNISPCTVLALLVPKKNNEWRLCVDSRSINKITIKYRFPVQRIDELIEKLDGASVFASTTYEVAITRFEYVPATNGKLPSKLRLVFMNGL